MSSSRCEPHLTRPLRAAVVLACVWMLHARVEAQSAATGGALMPRERVSIQGTRKLWQTLTMTFPTSVVTHESLHAAGRNPFLDYRLDVSFAHPASGTQHLVPGFYAADGDAADTSASGGHRWQCHFTPDRVGRWEWHAQFRKGPGIAVDPLRAGSPADSSIDGTGGELEIEPADPSAPGFLARGILRYVGEPYFRFAEDASPFLKSGLGGPENFLAYYEFDGTTGDPFNPCLSGPDFLHHYQAHAADYGGDAVDQAHTWGPTHKGKNLLGAINYLASRGLNSQYFIVHTDSGDGRDVWPWVAALDKVHYDVSKLAQWERVFAHMSARGIQLQFVFEEHENDQLPVPWGLGNGLTTERKLFYREMVARFAHHHAVLWVIGDESDYYDEPPVMESLAAEIRALDPYRHPIAFHSKHPCFGAGCPDPQPSILAQYQPYFGSESFEATVFQTTPAYYNNNTVALRNAQASSRKWAHHGDEQSLNATPPNLNDNRTKALWGNLMGGGAGVAWYPGNYDPAQYPGLDFCDYYDLTVEDFREFEGYLDQTRIAIEIFEAHLPFTEMAPDNALAAPSAMIDCVLVRPANAPLGIKAVYAVYRGSGSATALTLGSGTHSVEWHDPRTGAGPLLDADLVGPGPQPLEPPSSGPGIDWLAIVRQQ